MDAQGDGQKSYDLEERLLNYAAEIIKLVDEMPRTAAGRDVGGQLLRSGTAPLAHHGEAQGAESVRDFIHKLSLALKELRESLRWTKLVERAGLHKNSERVTGLRDE